MKLQWRKSAIQTSILAIMATIAFGAVGASAAETTNETNTKKTIQSTQTAGIKPTMLFHSMNSSLLVQPAHERNYWKLLATTYAPETLADWKEALEDRKQAESELPKSPFSNPTVEAVPATPSAQLDGVPHGDVITKGLMVERIESKGIPFEGAAAGDITKGELPESFKRQQKLAEAVEADDSDTIKSLLPELLNDYVKETESLRELTKKLKADIPAPAEK